MPIRVGLTTFKLNNSLAAYLTSPPEATGLLAPRHSVRAAYKLAKRLNVETVAALVAAYEAGQSRDDLSAAFGIAPSSVIKVLRGDGVALRWQRSSELEQQVVDLFSAGVTQAEIAKRLAKHKGYVWHVLNRHGLVGRK